MKLEILRYEPHEWKEYAESAHKLVFNELRHSDADRISFALLAHNGSDAISYTTCRELDNESVYWQYGGTIPEFRGLLAYRSVEALLEWTADRYKRVTTYVKNDNVGYLHMLMKLGFRAIGIRCFSGEIFLEMFKELK